MRSSASGFAVGNAADAAEVVAGVEQPVVDQAVEILKQKFGFSEFRAAQRQIVDHAIASEDERRGISPS